MKLRKRGSTYWIDTVIDGIRIQRTLRTTDHREAKKRAHVLIADVQQGKITTASLNFAKLKFGDACNNLLEQRKLELQTSTYTKEKQVTVRLRDFFQDKRLNEITADMVHKYRQVRAAANCKNSTINGEVGFLRRLLKKARLWHRICDDIKPLKEGRSIGRALSEEEVIRLRTKAAERPAWQTAYDAMILAVNTGMRGADIKALRWCDIDLFGRVLVVPKSKTPAGERSIPLTDEALKTLLNIRQRAEFFGEVSPGHYVFPAQKTGAVFDGNTIVKWQHVLFDPTRPIRSWRTAWRNLTEKAGMKGIRFHDLRHHVITKLIEDGVPDGVIMSIVGHVDRRMLDRYSHVRLEAKRAALSALSQANLPVDQTRTPTINDVTVPRDNEDGFKGYVTNHVTVEDDITVYSDLNPLESTKEGIGACGFEPQTPTVSKQGFVSFGVNPRLPKSQISLFFKPFCLPSPALSY
jgi:integrase